MKSYSFLIAFALMIGVQFNLIAQNDIAYTFNFESAKSKLPQTTIDELVNQAQKWKNHTIVIQGHTDNIGSEAYNLELANNRAITIKNILGEQGVDTSRIETKAWGAAQPIANNLTKEGQQKNRRVEILLTSQKDWNKDHQAIINKKLEKLIDKGGQFHTINPNIAQTVVAKQGTRIAIPAHAFDVPVGTKVKIKVTEVFKKSDIILYNLSTVSDDNFLVTGGMLKIEAFANGAPLELREGMELDIVVPTDNPTEEMQLFASQNINGNINWVAPQPLQINRRKVAPEHLNWNYKSPMYKKCNKEPKKQRKIQRPNTVDSNYLKYLEKRYAQLETDPMRGFKPFKSKNFLFWAYKVKTTSADSTAHIAKVGKMKKNVQKRIKREESELDELHGKHLVHQVYLQKKIEYKNWEKHRDSIWLENLVIAKKYKHYNGLVEYSSSLSFSQKDKLWTELYGNQNYDFRALKYNLSRRDETLCHKAMANNDTLSVNLIISQKYKQKLMCHIYKTDSVEVAYIAHLKNRDYVYYKQKSEELGISMEEVIRREKIQKEWQEKAGYAFGMGKLGSYINCDFFPRQFPQEMLTKCQTQLNRPLSQTKTMLVFENFNTVMNGYNDYGVMNGCAWPNIPLDQPVKMISMYLDEKGETYVSLKRLKTTQNLPTLEYKAMSLEDFEKVILGLNS